MRIFKKPEIFKHKINSSITSIELRLVGDNIERQGQIFKLDDALKLAKQLDLDLVETSSNSNPPIAKIIDYKKFLYLEEKRVKEQNKKQKENNKPLKEVQFTPNIAIADIETKSKHIKEFLLEGHKVKIVIKFKQGRELNNMKERAEQILIHIQESLSEISKVDFPPKLIGKNMLLNLSPKK